MHISICNKATWEQCNDGVRLWALLRGLTLFMFPLLAHFKPGELSERQQKLNKTMSILSKLGEQFNIAIVITNQVMSDPGATMTFIANPMKPGMHIFIISPFFSTCPVHVLYPIKTGDETEQIRDAHVFGGHVIGHASTIRLSLRKGKGDQRVCKVYDAPNLPETECIFQLSDSGVIDATD
ncbi:meiotic recombination protein DMC1, putative (DMC1) [Plasmodium ovale wallikeri]|uniref:Meiotic recombination protein DMC1, putative (DMC1) n=1 Tax=Plasmodium ovale wallikeri TaxID=864142 RepID=A0A1A8ZLF7_PLAOA|nr:meiotic recombination protein DMC1, putative (DMC1) [Plasmodium ovale wallikeri]